MDERLPQKIALVAVFAVFLAGPAHAKEEFVPYKEAASVLAPPAPGAAEPGTIRPEELRAAQEKGESFVIFDARTKEEHAAERLPGAKLSRGESYYRDMELFRQKITREGPSSKLSLENATKGMSRATPIVTYCRSHCGLSKTLKTDLEELGFTNVRWLDGGIDVWREKGYPLEKS